MRVREGWTLGVGALFGAAGAVVGLLIVIGVAPDNGIDVGTALILLGLSTLVP